jgi:hypothetical protein
MTGNFSPFLPTVQGLAPSDYHLFRTVKRLHDGPEQRQCDSSQSYVNMDAECWKTATAASYSNLYSTGRNVWIIMGILWKNDSTSVVTENDICFCKCNLILIYCKHDHYFQYGPHRISTIVGLKNWRVISLNLLKPSGNFTYDQV